MNFAVDLLLVFGAPLAIMDLVGYVGGELDDFERSAAHVHDRIVGGLNPDFPAAFADAFVLGRLIFASGKGLPELGICLRGCFRRLDKHAVMLALNFRQLISNGAQKVCVGVQDMSRQIERNDSLGFVDCCKLSG